MKTAKTSLWEVIAGIWILAAVVIAVSLIGISHPVPYVLGEIAGSLAAMLLMLELYHSVDVELDLPEKRAVSHSRLHAILRSCVELALLVAAFFAAEWISPYTVLIGLLGRKFGTLLVPLMERIRCRKQDENR